MPRGESLSKALGASSVDVVIDIVGGDQWPQFLEVLKPGGRGIVLEFSKPESELLGKAYDAYSFNVIPAIGRLVANDSESYQYLAE